MVLFKTPSVDKKQPKAKSNTLNGFEGKTALPLLPAHCNKCLIETNMTRHVSQLSRKISRTVDNETPFVTTFASLTHFQQKKNS